MSVTAEKTGVNEMKITIPVSNEKFEEGMTFSYNKNKTRLNIPGFRKGKVPRALAEKFYGRGYFYDDAINHILPDLYEAAIEELELEPVGRPEIDIESFDEEEGVVLTAVISIKPEVTVSDYKGLTYEKSQISVTDDDIEREIDGVREKNSRIITVMDRPIKDGDITVIDFEGFITNEDGQREAFAGGKGEGYELKIGSHSFIDTFEEQLIGLNVGDNKEINVIFPEAYQAEDLAGKPAVFEVVINEIKVKELPEADDEFAQDVSEFDTIKEYREDFRKKITAAKEEEAERIIENQLLDKLINVVEIDVPKVMIENQVDNYLNDFEYRLRMQGMNLEMFAQYSGETVENMRIKYNEPAEKAVRGRLILEAIAKVENFTATDEEIVEEVKKMIGSSEADINEVMDRIGEAEKRGISNDINTKKALALIVENATAEKGKSEAKPKAATKTATKSTKTTATKKNKE